MPFRKGDQHAGGGGYHGGGGKRGLPPIGHWEKGDIVRDVDLDDSPVKIHAKPGRLRKQTHHHKRKRAARGPKLK